MCRRPAIRSTSGLTRRASDLITRLVCGPRRRAFRAGRGCASGPGVVVGLLYGPGGFRPGVADIVDLRLRPDLRPVQHQDERRAGNVTGRTSAVLGTAAPGRTPR